MGWKLATDCSHSDIILTVTALASIIQLVWLSTIESWQESGSTPILTYTCM